MVEAVYRARTDAHPDEIFGEACQIRQAGARQRFILRCAEPMAWAGLQLSMPINRFLEKDARRAARLGPDEYWLFAPIEAHVGLEMASDLASKHHALIDVSHAQCGVELSGSCVGEVINAGCPLDLGLAAFPIQMATRTLLGKVSILLLRQSETSFAIECARSSTNYVREFLQAAAQEYAGS